jgi:hypothetical protein
MMASYRKGHEVYLLQGRRLVGLGIVVWINVNKIYQGVSLRYGRIGVMVDKVFSPDCHIPYEGGSNKVLMPKNCVLWNVDEVRPTSSEVLAAGLCSQDVQRHKENNKNTTGWMIERRNSTSQETHRS